MTKAELLKALEPFADDQCVYVRFHNDFYPQGCQLRIQGVRTAPPWVGDGPSLVGLDVHFLNRKLREDGG